ncbi:MAG: tetratricopeptide repeat protein [Spirochaetales bacterium]|nr:tetratricopeptide repeat protein [Spirochaetales bacterium]
MQKELTSKQKILNSLAGFFQKYRLIMLIVTVAIIFGIVAVGVIGEIDKSITRKSSEALYKLEGVYGDWQMKESAEMKTRLPDVVNDCDALINKYGNTYSGEKAAFFKAEAYYQTEDYNAAADAYNKLFHMNKNGILAPSALFNVAVAYEQLGDNEKAVEYYEKLAGIFGKKSPLTPHALLNAGRLYADMNNIEKARASFTLVIEDYAGSNWTNLARTSIIQLGK